MSVRQQSVECTEDDSHDIIEPQLLLANYLNNMQNTSKRVDWGSDINLVLVLLNLWYLQNVQLEM